VAGPLENSETSSDHGDSEETRLPSWFNISVLLGFAGVLAFSTAWIYVHTLSLVLQLEFGELARYFDISDYVLITPIGASNFIVFFPVIGFYLLTGIRKFYFPLSRRALKPTIFALAVLLFSPILVAGIQGWYLPPPWSEVTLKSDHPNIQGRVIFSLNRYLLIYTERQNAEQGSLTAIPQTEIQMIRTPPE
jgi:hypothetical protein